MKKNINRFIVTMAWWLLVYLVSQRRQVPRRVQVSGETFVLRLMVVMNMRSVRLGFL